MKFPTAMVLTTTLLSFGPLAIASDGSTAAAEKPKEAAAKKPAAPKGDTKVPPRQPLATPQNPVTYSTGPKVLRDKEGNVIPTHPDAYPVDSALPARPRK